MFPELVCQALIKMVIEELDPQREGAAIEIGVGTGNFYSVDYSEVGLRVIAVDPIPSQNFLTIAKELNITYEESCIYDIDGELEIFLNTFTDLSSLNKNWWGVDKKNSKKVKSLRLETFIIKHSIRKITFLKVDTEGSEYEIIKQLKDINSDLLPASIEFEYGGGAIKETEKGGWEPEFFDNVINTLSLLKKLGYEEGLIVDSKEAEFSFFNLQDVQDFSLLFKPHFEYGNVVLFKKRLLSRQIVERNIYKLESIELGKKIAKTEIENRDLRIQVEKRNYTKRVINKIKRTLNLK